ncbi:outer membrane beta-barrel protein [Tenacibaculum ovolyticum]|uniref:outer membrane beta-barrel protein n=1 Tax=Tenacibaculum ovolyticum TaxID=104270 RepID=UPI0007EDBB47|nr:outer membrane beta-barrel protein [Tenacibaculum ovolyticum]
MKKVLLLIAIVAAGFTANAQDAKTTEGQTAKGKFLIEGNTGFGQANPSSTSFFYKKQTGSDASYNLGLEGGYFVMDDLAVKLGLGYGDNGTDDTFSYKIGAKYYVISKIPVQIDYSGNTNDASFLGFQAGYAIFLGDMVSVEPGFRYNLGLGDSDGFNSAQFNIGFALHI